MSDSQHRVTFQPQGRSVSVLEGTTILEAAAVAGLVIDTPCGGAGTCGKCRVQVSQGSTQPCDSDRKTFTGAELAEGWRLACRHHVHGDLVAHVPTGSLREYAVARRFPGLRCLLIPVGARSRHANPDCGSVFPS